MEVNQYVELIVTLAREVELGDPIDWATLSIGEDEAYRLMASNVVDQLLPKYTDSDFREVLMAIVVKLVVENFCLNLRLAGIKDG